MADPTDEEAEAEAAGLAVESGGDDIWVPLEFLSDDSPAPTSPSQNAYNAIKHMSVSERVKLALRGGKEARLLLVRDPNRLIRRFVLQNPRITEQEVIAIAQEKTAEEEALRTIAARREWMKSYQIRMALVKNPRTPFAIALSQLGTILERDLARLAKSRDVPENVAVHARRMVTDRQSRK
jgi:hypothetical protein